ncbi:hypothetical protein ACRAWD_10360 [Caulobacter segnis]
MAEALADAGVELHVLLPVDPAAFRTLSVTPWGEAWGVRFDGLMARAESVRGGDAWRRDDRCADDRPRRRDRHGPGCAEGGDRGGRGRAVGGAGRRRGGASARAAARWIGGGRRRWLLTAPRLTTGAVSPTDPATRLAAFLGCAVDLPADGADRDRVLRTLARVVQDGPSPITAPSWSGRTLLLVHETPAEAARAARAIPGGAGRARVRLAGSYGLTAMAPDPFGEGRLAVGAEAEAVARLLVTTPSGAIHLGLAFAAALSGNTRPRISLRPVTDLTGDELGPYALRL